MDRVDAVEQIFAKLPPPRYHSEQVAVRGADEADVHRYGRVAAHAEDTPALDGRQQLRLQVGRQVADLVEEKRAVVGDLEFPGAVGPGVGEGSLDMAEQFALEERFGYGSHIHRNHQFAAARRAVVYLACQHLLAGAVLPRDQDVGVRGRNLLHDFADARHGGAFAPEHRLLRGQLALDLLELLHLASRPRQIVGVAQRSHQPVVVPRFDDEVHRTVAHCPHGQVDIGVRREEHDFDIRPAGVDLAQPVDAFVTGVDARREIHVEQDHVDLFLAQGRRQPVGGGEGQHPCEIFFQQQAQRRQDAAVVVHDQ